MYTEGRNLLKEKVALECNRSYDQRTLITFWYRTPTRVGRRVISRPLIGKVQPAHKVFFQECMQSYIYNTT
jgi:hypothetical protein